MKHFCTEALARGSERPANEVPQAAAPASTFLVDCNAYRRKPLEYKTVSEALDDNRVVSVTREADGTFCVEERCDEYYRAYLTREQLLAWADELRALAGMPNTQGERALPEAPGSPSSVAERSSALATGPALPEWMNTPEKRRRIWAWMALAAAFVGDDERAGEYERHAQREDAECAVPIV